MFLLLAKQHLKGALMYRTACTPKPATIFSDISVNFLIIQNLKKKTSVEKQK